MGKWLRHTVLNVLTKHLLKAVTEDDVLLITSQAWLVGKRKLSSEEIFLLKEEARSFKESTLYQLLKRELKYDMTLQRYNHAKTADDMLYGKSMADCISKIELYVKKICEL